MRNGYKISMITGIALSVGLAFLMLGTISCSMLDLNGDDKIDPIAYLEGMDVTIGFLGDDGETYNMAVDELGKKIVGQFIQTKTGYLFDVTEYGGINITGPDNVKIQIKPKLPEKNE